jgi:putative hydrolase
MNPIRFDEDWHVHSTFSDGASTIAENASRADSLGLRRICMVDHVRRDTSWVGEFIATARSADCLVRASVLCGVEAKLLDTLGTLDLPPDGDRADYIFAADHQLPTPSGPMHPAEARECLDAGELTPEEVIFWLVRASANAVLRYDRVVLAHPFSIVPKLGLDPDQIDLTLVEWLARLMACRGACTEVSERWRCPAPRILQSFLGAGVRVLASTDSHHAEAIGAYSWSQGAAAEARSELAPRHVLA